MGSDTPSVFVVIVTYNRPATLTACMESVLQQEGVDLRELHVVVNSKDQGTIEAIETIRMTTTCAVTFQRLRNEGPAGGFHEGIKRFLESSIATHVWLMDDDIVARPGALQALVANAGQCDMVYPIVVTPEMEEVNAYGWWGVLLARDLVKKIGLPMKELFYWSEDAEYLQSRVVFQLGITPLRVKDAVVNHLHKRNLKRPNWYYYYTIRNTLYYRLYRVRFTRYGLTVLFLILPKLIFMILFKEDRKLSKLKLLALGFIHGLFGKLGRTVDPELNR